MSDGYTDSGDTTREAQALAAGRELDAVIAERIFGHTVTRDWPCGYDPECGYYEAASYLQIANGIDPEQYSERGPVFDVGTRVTAVPFYSTGIAAAWVVVEAMAARPGYKWDLGLYCHSGGEWEAWFAVPIAHRRYNTLQYDVLADTAPLAICQAALIAVSKESPARSDVYYTDSEATP